MSAHQPMKIITLNMTNVWQCVKRLNGKNHLHAEIDSDGDTNRIEHTEWARQKHNDLLQPWQACELKTKKQTQRTLNFIYFYYLLHYIKRAMNPISEPREEKNVCVPRMPLCTYTHTHSATSSSSNSSGGAMIWPSKTRIMCAVQFERGNLQEDFFCNGMMVYTLHCTHALN